MAKPKKVPGSDVIDGLAEIQTPKEQIHNPIEFLTVDYPNEWLNDMARKINQIIEHIHAKIP